MATNLGYRFIGMAAVVALTAILPTTGSVAGGARSAALPSNHSFLFGATTHPSHPFGPGVEIAGKQLTRRAFLGGGVFHHHHHHRGYLTFFGAGYPVLGWWPPEEPVPGPLVAPPSFPAAAAAWPEPPIVDQRPRCGALGQPRTVRLSWVVVSDDGHSPCAAG